MLLSAGCTTTRSASGPAAVQFDVAELLAPSTARQPGVTVEGAPGKVPGPHGQALAFDGHADRVVLQQNPLAGADEFTLEVVLRPRDVYPQSPEPRFLHIEAASNPDRRLTMELRLTAQHQWYLDAFIKSDDDKLTLIDATRVHAVGQWAHVAVTYRAGTFTTYVDGKPELQGAVRYQPIPDDARTSIGARLNRVHWFAGDIATVRVTHAALAPSSFKGVPRSP